MNDITPQPKQPIATLEADGLGRFNIRIPHEFHNRGYFHYKDHGRVTRRDIFYPLYPMPEEIYEDSYRVTLETLAESIGIPYEGLSDKNLALEIDKYLIFE